MYEHTEKQLKVLEKRISFWNMGLYIDYEERKILPKKGKEIISFFYGLSLLAGRLDFNNSAYNYNFPYITINDINGIDYTAFQSFDTPFFYRNVYLKVADYTFPGPIDHIVIGLYTYRLLQNGNILFVVDADGKILEDNYLYSDLTTNNKLYCSCSNPIIIPSYTFAGKEFSFCTNCKKEKK